MKKKTGVGLLLLGCGAVVGAVLTKRYCDKRKVRVADYNAEVERLKSEADFEISEEFLKEWRREAVGALDLASLKKDLLNVLIAHKEKTATKLEKLENTIKSTVQNNKEEFMTSETLEEYQPPVEIKIEEKKAEEEKSAEIVEAEENSDVVQLDIFNFDEDIEE